MIRTNAARLAAVVVALSGCNGPRDDLGLHPPNFLAVGSSTSMAVGVVGDEVGPPVRITAVSCRYSKCSIVRDADRSNAFVLRALAPGDDELVVKAERDDSEWLVSRPVTFWSADRIEADADDRVMREGLGVLVGSKVSWSVEAYANALRDHLLVSDDDTSFKVRGRVLTISPRGIIVPGTIADKVEVLALTPGTGTVFARAAGVEHAIEMRVAAEDDVERIELLRLEYAVRALASGASPLAYSQAALDAFPLESEELVPVLHLRDGSLALGGGERMTFDPPELVSLTAKDRLVRLRAQANGKGILRLRVGSASFAVALQTRKPM